MAACDASVAAAASGAPLPVLGTAVGRVAAPADRALLETIVKEAAPGLPWPRAVLQQGGGQVAMFFPAASLRAAFLLCERLAAAPVPCSPAVVPAGQLFHFDGTPVTRATLQRLGVAPYRPGKAGRRLG